MNKLYTFLLPFLLTACGTYQSVTQSEEAAYIQFMGKPQLLELSIDGKASGNLRTDFESFNLNGETATRIQLTPGSHEIELRRDGNTIIHRKIYVSEGNIFEINLP